MKTGLLFAVVFVVLLAVYAFGDVGNSQLAQLAAEKAAVYEEQRDWSNALDYYAKAVELDPNESYRFKAAYAATQCSPPCWSEAEKHLRTNRQTDSLLLLTEVYQKQKRWKDAQKTVEKVQPKQSIDSARLLRAQGYLAFDRWRDAKREDDAKSAIGGFSEYLSKNPNVTDRNRIQEHLRVLQYGELGEKLNMAIQVFRAGEFDRAWGFLDPLECEAEQCFEPLYWRGQICAAASEDNPYYDASGKASEDYWRQAETVPEAHLALANLYLKRGDPGQAKHEAEAAVARAPNWLPPLFLLGKIHQAMGESAMAVKQFECVINIAPDSTEAEQARQELEFRPPWPPPAPPVNIDTLLNRYGPVVDSPEISQRLEAVAFQLYHANGSPGTLPQIRLLASQHPNAWSVPQNQIFVTVGMIAFVDTHPDLKPIADDVLAFVLGHEWTHTLQNDYYRSQKAQELIFALREGQPVAWELLKAGLGRAAEEHADRQGMLFAYRAKYKPYAGIAWCEASIAHAGDWRSDGTHPSLGERQQKMESFLEGQMLQAYQAFETGGVAFNAFQKASWESDWQTSMDWLNRATLAFEAYYHLFPNDGAALENLSVLYFLHGAAWYRRPRHDGEAVDPPWGKWRLAHDIQVDPELPPPLSKPSMVIPVEVRRWWEMAERYAILLLRVNPDSPGAYQIIGDVALGFGQTQKAVDMYQKGLEISPAHRGLLNNLGVLHARRGDIQDTRNLWTAIKDLPAAAWNLAQQPQR